MRFGTENYVVFKFKQDAVGAYIWASMYYAYVNFFFMCIISGFGFEMREVEGVELYWTLNCKIMAVVC